MLLAHDDITTSKNPSEKLSQLSNFILSQLNQPNMRLRIPGLVPCLLFRDPWSSVESSLLIRELRLLLRLPRIGFQLKTALSVVSSIHGMYAETFV